MAATECAKTRKGQQRILSRCSHDLGRLNLSMLYLLPLPIVHPLPLGVVALNTVGEPQADLHLSFYEPLRVVGVAGMATI